MSYAVMAKSQEERPPSESPDASKIRPNIAGNASNDANPIKPLREDFDPTYFEGQMVEFFIHIPFSNQPKNQKPRIFSTKDQIPLNELIAHAEEHLKDEKWEISGGFSFMQSNKEISFLSTKNLANVVTLVSALNELVNGKTSEEVYYEPDSPPIRLELRPGMLLKISRALEDEKVASHVFKFDEIIVCILDRLKEYTEIARKAEALFFRTSKNSYLRSLMSIKLHTSIEIQLNHLYHEVLNNKILPELSDEHYKLLEKNGITNYKLYNEENLIMHSMIRETIKLQNPPDLEVWETETETPPEEPLELIEQKVEVQSVVENDVSKSSLPLSPPMKKKKKEKRKKTQAEVTSTLVVNSFDQLNEGNNFKMPTVCLSTVFETEKAPSASKAIAVAKPPKKPKKKQKPNVKKQEELPILGPEKDNTRFYVYILLCAIFLFVSVIIGYFTFLD